VEFTLDHVVLVVPDLEVAAAALQQRLGLRASPGGRHPALGTENALVAVGGAYLELVAVADEHAARSTPFGRAALTAREQGPRFAGWVARVGDLDAAAQAMGEVVVPMSRLTPAGERVTWHMARVDRLGDGGAVTPLISWDDPATAPPFAPAQTPPAPSPWSTPRLATRTAPSAAISRRCTASCSSPSLRPASTPSSCWSAAAVQGSRLTPWRTEARSVAAQRVAVRRGGPTRSTAAGHRGRAPARARAAARRG
jgi:hypothetical protein